MTNELIEAFNNDCKKIDTAATLLEDLEKNLKNETMKELEELKNLIVKGSEQEIIMKISEISELRKDWIMYRDTKAKIVETLANVTLSFLKKNG